MSELVGRVAIVTGGGGGIGTAVCRKLALSGAMVAVVDVNGACAKSVAEEISTSGASARGWALDVSNASEVERVFGEVEATMGPMDVLVNVAAVFHPCP